MVIGMGNPIPAATLSIAGTVHCDNPNEGEHGAQLEAAVHCDCQKSCTTTN